MEGRGRAPPGRNWMARRGALAGRVLVWLVATLAFVLGAVRMAACVLQIVHIRSDEWLADAQGVLEMGAAEIARHRAESVAECAVQLATIAAGTLLTVAAVSLRVPGALLSALESSAALRRTVPREILSAVSAGLWALLLGCSYAMLGGMAADGGATVLAMRLVVLVSTPMLYALVCSMVCECGAAESDEESALKESGGEKTRATALRRRPAWILLGAAMLVALILSVLCLVGVEVSSFRMRRGRPAVQDALLPDSKAGLHALLSRASPPVAHDDVLLAECGGRTSFVGTLLYDTVYVHPADLGAGAAPGTACCSACGAAGRSSASLAAIVGHELGHRAERLAVPRAAFLALQTHMYCVLPLAVSLWGGLNGALSSALGVPPTAPPVIGALSVLLLLERALADAAFPLRLAWTRAREYEADRHAVEVLGAQPAALVAALRPYGPAANCAAAARPYELLFLTHPPMNRRLRAVREYVPVDA